MEGGGLKSDRGVDQVVCSFGTADTPSQGQTQESDIIGLPPIGAEHDRYALARSPTDASSVEGVSSFMIPPAGGIQSTAPITNQIGHDLHSPKTGLAATTNQILNHSNEFNPDLFFMPFDNIGFNTNFDWIFESSGIEECESDMFLNIANDQEDSPSQLLPISAPKTLTQSTTMPVVIDDSVEDGYSSGSERLFEHSESCRHSLIYHAKCMGLFRSEGNNHAPLGATKQEKWQNYIRAESSRRLGWAVFQYDSSVAYLHNNRPFLGLADLNFNLPGSREHWEAENADVWASFHPWSKSVPLTSPLRPKLASFFDGSPDPAGNLSEEHLLIISLMLLSMLWSIKEFRSFPLEDLARPLGFENGRQAMMHAMDQIKVPILAMADSHTQSEMERLVDRTQLAHIAHIYGAGDLMNWLFPYLRNDAERDTVKTRMLRWANEDHRRTREVTYHSAQILGLVRHYPSLMPVQSFLLFHAGVILSCMSFLLPESCTPCPGPPIQLEKLGSEESADLMRWLESGGSSVISLTGVPSLCCPTGRRLVLDQTASLLKRHKTWGIAENLMKVILSLSKQDA
ncbi:unnamed protein product [Alternaria alternata]